MCLDHKLITAKLNIYSFNIPVLRLIHNYLSNKKQRMRIGNTYRTSMKVVFEVTQGSTLRPLLFNIFLADLLFIISNKYIASYADDNC